MGFRDDIRRIIDDVDAEDRAIFAEVVSLVHESIVEGSPLTGSPGQPVDTGALRNSWTPAFNSPGEASVATNLEYAQVVEDNIGDRHYKNHGPHSVKLTIAGLDRLVDEAARRITPTHG